MSAINIDKISFCTKPSDESRERKIFADMYLGRALGLMGSTRDSKEYYICVNNPNEAVCKLRS